MYNKWWGSSTSDPRVVAESIFFRIYCTQQPSRLYHASKSHTYGTQNCHQVWRAKAVTSTCQREAPWIEGRRAKMSSAYLSSNVFVCVCVCIQKIGYACTYTHANKSRTFFETRHQSVHYQFRYPGPVFQQRLPIVKLKLVEARNNKSFPRSCKGAPRPSPSAGWSWWTHIPWGGLDRGLLKEQMMLMNKIRLSSGDRSTLLSLSLMYHQNWPARDFGKKKVLRFLIFQFLACVHDVS